MPPLPVWSHIPINHAVWLLFAQAAVLQEKQLGI